MSGLAVLLTMAVSAAGAYSLTRYRYLGREKIAGLILCTYMFAPIMVVIPFFILVKKLGIENTHFALVLAFTSFCLPFTLWLMRAFFETIPMELEEAALVDGAGRVRAVDLRHPAAGPAGDHRHVHLHLHPGVERLHLHPDPHHLRRAEDAARGSAGPLPLGPDRLGTDHGRGDDDHDPGAALLRYGAALSDPGLGRRRRQGVII